MLTLCIQIVGFLAAGLTYSTAIINDLVYSPDGDKEAAAAGFILLSMVMVSSIVRSRIDNELK